MLIVLFLYVQSCFCTAKLLKFVQSQKYFFILLCYLFLKADSTPQRPCIWGAAMEAERHIAKPRVAARGLYFRFESEGR